MIYLKTLIIFGLIADLVFWGMKNAYPG